MTFSRRSCASEGALPADEVPATTQVDQADASAESSGADQAFVDAMAPVLPIPVVDWWNSDAPAPASVVGQPEANDPSETPTAPIAILSTAQLAEAQLTEQTERLEDQLDSSDFEGTRRLDTTSAPALSAHISHQGLSAMAARDIGRVRETNQDSVFALLCTLPRESCEVQVGLFVVADGMGGHQGGEIASRMAVHSVVQHVVTGLLLPALNERMDEELQVLMIGAIQTANTAIWEMARCLGNDMGTTCTAALLVGSSLYLAHVGDSRAYLYEPGGLRQLTNDHSTVGRLIQLGQLDPHEAREHPLRNQLYRTVGQQPHVPVDFLYQPLGASSHLLLCSDGLWGMIEEPLLAQALVRSPWPQDACDELIALANLAGGDDNISAVVVTLPLIER